MINRKKPIVKYSFAVIYKILTLTIIFPFLFMAARAQTNTGTTWLVQYIRSHASPFLLHILDHPDSFHYQILYTKVDRDKKNQPHLKYFAFRVHDSLYFNPCSTVKLPTALAALEKINKMHRRDLLQAEMLTGAEGHGETVQTTDSTTLSGKPSLANYIKKIFLVSDNDAYNRVFEFVGQKDINQAMWQKGYTGSRIVRRFAGLDSIDNRYTNPISFVKNGQILYQQPLIHSDIHFDFSIPHLVGKGHFNDQDSLIHTPMDFTTHNLFLLRDMQTMLQSVIFPTTVTPNKRYLLTGEDRHFLLQYMSELPFESREPLLDTVEYFPSYTKFFFFRAGKTKPPAFIRSFNKAGWAYGYLIDNAYIVDTKNKVEWMLTATIHTNANGILNSEKNYEWEQIGFPFFKEIGEIMYQYELQRERKYTPDLSDFLFDYH